MFNLFNILKERKNKKKDIRGINKKVKKIKKDNQHNNKKIKKIKKDNEHYNEDNNKKYTKIMNISKINKQKLISNNVKTGVIITTHGFYGVFARQCLESFIRELPKNHFIVLFINESQDEITLDLIKKYKDNKKIKIIYNKNQEEIGGLTGTWNKGIDLCLENNCDVIILSNDDILFDKSINNILWSCYEERDEIKYFGPLSNNPGPKNCPINMCQYSIKPLLHNNRKALYKEDPCNLNGFFMVFSRKVLQINKFDNNLYFDPSYPFGGNETEWFDRFKNIGGLPIIVPQTFIYHYKIARWRENNIINNTCIYTINTGSYEGENINHYKSTIDTLYYTDNFKTIYKCINKGLLPFYINTKGKEFKLVQRTIKTNPTEYLPFKYEKSVYVDGNINIINYGLLKNYIGKLNLYDIICFEHPKRNLVKDEAKIVIIKKLEKQDNVNRILNEFNSINFKDDIGLTETGFLIRNHKKIKEFNEDWCRCINICRRDQISFDYLLFKHNIKYKRFSDNIKKIIFKWIQHINPINRNIKNI